VSASTSSEWPKDGSHLGSELPGASRSISGCLRVVSSDSGQLSDWPRHSGRVRCPTPPLTAIPSSRGSAATRSRHGVSTPEAEPDRPSDPLGVFLFLAALVVVGVLILYGMLEWWNVPILSVFGFCTYVLFRNRRRRQAGPVT
jgi:hypothetical protein